MIVRALLICVISSLFAACASEHNEPEKPSTGSAPFYCGNTPGCAAITGGLMLIYAASKPMSTAEKRSHRHSLWGFCELQKMKDGKPDGKAEACDQVLLTITGPNAFKRQHWVTTKEFEVLSLGEGPYSVEAYSERYDARARLENAMGGTYLRIRLEVPVKATLPASTL